MSSIQAKNHEVGCTCQGTAPRGRATGVTVSAYLERDHREIDTILSDVESLVRRGDSAAGPLFSRFRKRLERHIGAEEEILFPVYEQLSASDGPTRVMLGEHAEIRRLMATLADGFERPNFTQVIDALSKLARVLSEHNVKEELVLYPGTDAALERDIERDSLVARLREHLDQ
jgi:hemerythrin-like domain-containing protein